MQHELSRGVYNTQHMKVKTTLGGGPAEAQKRKGGAGGETGR